MNRGVPSRVLLLALSITVVLLSAAAVKAEVIWPEDHAFPRIAPPPEVLYVVDLRGADFYHDFKPLALVTLQGLVNRERPSLYLIFCDMDARWLEILKERYGIRVEYLTVEEAMRRFAKYARGYIVYDDKVPDTVNIATTMAGLEDCIVIHPSLIAWASHFGLKKVEDLRGRFRGMKRADIYRWAFEHLWPRCEHRLLATISPGPPVCPHNPMQLAGRDYAVALRLFVQYLDAKNPDERALLIKILKNMPDNGIVLGWFEEEEGDYVSLASKYRKVVVVIYHHYGPLSVANPTIWASLVPPKEPRFPLPRLQKELLGLRKIYVTFYVTDGDNLQWDYNMLSLWNQTGRGEVPVAWTVSPFLVDFAPAILDYYASTASENDTFVSGPSGSGYWYPRENPGYLPTFLEMCRRYFERSGLRFTEILGMTDQAAAMYAKALDIYAIKKEYKEIPGERHYYVGDGTPVVVGTLHYSAYRTHDFAFRLKLLASRPQRPQFILVISQPWDIVSMGLMANTVRQLAKEGDFVFVNFYTFVAMLNPKLAISIAEELIEEAKSKGADPELLSKASSLLDDARRQFNLGFYEKAAASARDSMRFARLAIVAAEKPDAAKTVLEALDVVERLKERGVPEEAVTYAQQRLDMAIDALLLGRFDEARFHASHVLSFAEVLKARERRHRIWLLSLLAEFAVIGVLGALLARGLRRRAALAALLLLLLMPAILNAVPALSEEEKPPVYIVAIRGLRGWWLEHPEELAKAVASELKKAGFEVNFVQDLDEFCTLIESPPEGAVIVNCHGEIVPLPEKYISGNTPLWQDFFSLIRRAIVERGVIWVHLEGYPFYLVANPHYSSWSYLGTRTLHEVGTIGATYILGTVDCFSEGKGPKELPLTPEGAAIARKYNVKLPARISGPRWIRGELKPVVALYADQGWYGPAVFELGNGFYVHCNPDVDYRTRARILSVLLRELLKKLEVRRLRVSISVPNYKPYVGEEISLRVTIRNVSRYNVTNVKLSLEARGASVTAPGSEISIGALGPRSSTEVEIKLRIEKPTVELKATVSGEGSEPASSKVSLKAFELGAEAGWLLHMVLAAVIAAEAAALLLTRRRGA